VGGNGPVTTPKIKYIESFFDLEFFNKGGTAFTHGFCDAGKVTLFP